MELIIPSRNKPNSGSFPVAPKKVRQWIAGLYPVTSANATQTLLRGLKHSNRLENTARSRMEILSSFKPAVREIIDSATSRYVGQNLPLGSKEHNTFKTVITLLQEMAFGYKIIASEAVQSAFPGSGKLRYHAIILAMDALNEIALRHLQVYEDIPSILWQDSNTLYKLSEELAIHQKPLGRDAGIAQDMDTTEEILAASHLLYLAGSHSLRRGQILQLHEFIAKHIKHVQLQAANYQPEKQEGVYTIDLDCAAPASGVRFANPEVGNAIRYLDLHNFLKVLVTETNNTPNSVSALYESDVLTRESLYRLKQSLATDHHERRFSREFCHEKLDFLHGLKEIYAIFRYAEQPQQVPAFLQAANEPKLELVQSDNRIKKSPETDFITHPGFTDQLKENHCGKLSKKVASPLLSKLAGPIRNWKPVVVIDNSRGDWILLNRSEGGLGLIWSGESSPHISVGELVASRNLSDEESSSWITGVVTWLRVDEHQNLRCGISHVAQNVQPILVERTRGSHNSITTQTECLMAQTLEPEPRTCIFVPAYMFHSGEIIHTREDKTVHHFKLLEKLDSTGSFALFTVETVGSSMTGDGLAKKELGDFGIEEDER